MSKHFISFQNVTKSYGSGKAQIHALDGVSFEIEQGESVFCSDPPAREKQRF